MVAIVLASTNNTKLNATISSFQKMFPDTDFSILTQTVDSQVRSQPLSTGETLQGAMNRLDEVKRLIPIADFYIAIEGGIDDQNGEMYAFAWIVVSSKNFITKNQTARFLLPQQVATLIRGGLDMAEASKLIFGISDLSLDVGTVGVLTENVIDRAAFYEQAMILALIPYKHPDLYLV